MPPVILFNQSSWSIKPMVVDDIPLVVSWIAALDESRKVDEVGYIQVMAKELDLARQGGFAKHYVGYFQLLAIFYIDGFYLKKDFEIANLLMNPLLPRSIYLITLYKGVKFLFQRTRIQRILIHSHKGNAYENLIMLRLGFRPIEKNGKEIGSDQTYACRRTDLIFLECL